MKELNNEKEMFLKLGEPTKGSPSLENRADDSEFEVTMTPQSYRVLPPMIYKAKLVNITIMQGICHSGKNYVPDFEIVLPKQEGITDELKESLIGCKINDLIEIKYIDGNLKKAPRNSTLRLMVNALMGKDFSDYQQFNLKKLVGMECYIKVEQNLDKGKGHINQIKKYFSTQEIEGESK